MIREIYQNIFQQAMLEFPEPPAQAQEVHGDRVEVKSGLLGLMHSTEWTAAQWQFFYQWLKKIDVAKKHYHLYEANWKLAQDRAAIDPVCYQLTALAAIRTIADMSEQDIPVKGQFYKTINALYKLLDRVAHVFKIDTASIHQVLDQLLDDVEVVSRNCDSEHSTFERKNAELLPVVVLFSEGPIARAYLETIRSMGFKVKKIIKMVSKNDLVTHKPVGQFLPQSIKLNYAANKQYKQMFYWPNEYLKKHKSLVQSVQKAVTQTLGFSQHVLTNATQNIDLSVYSDDVKTLLISGLRDDELAALIKQEASELFLYTGGGIVPNQLLSIPGKRLVHVHPGHLPEIKGADCVLWSQLIHQRLSASAFFMAPGIDVGDVIQACWLPQINIEFPEGVNADVKYRLIFGFLDPWVRSFVLQKWIENNPGLSDLIGLPQDDLGLTYHFMHKKMIVRAMEKFT